MRVAVHQPNYAPWNGYFAKMLASDVFVLFDDAQYSKGSFINRTKIAKGDDAERWLTVPVLKSGSPAIDKVGIADSQFAAKHLSTLRHTYSRTPYFGEVLELLTPVYERATDSLATFNIDLIKAFAGYLGWEGRFVLSSDRPSTLMSDERVADLVSWVGGDTYVSGAGGENYQTDQTYSDRGVSLEVLTYHPIEYDRSGWGWVPGLSCIDAFFHRGRASRDSMFYSDDST